MWSVYADSGLSDAANHKAYEVHLPNIELFLTVARSRNHAVGNQLEVLFQYLWSDPACSLLEGCAD